MTGGSELNLSGQWTGIFNYPADFPPNSFEAIVRDVGGTIAGTVTEQDDDPMGSGATLHSVIEGRRHGNAVTFTKIYDDVDRLPDPIFYTGTLEPEGNEIAGRWEIPGQWSGTFLMIRGAGASEVVEAETVERV